MARSTGPILAVGALTMANRSLLSPKQEPPDFRVVVGTVVAAAGLALVERLNEQIAVGIAYIALVTVLFVRVGNQPAPSENLLRIMRGNQR